MPSTYNGLGTAYFGRREERADGSYITTEFSVYCDIPIRPLGSYRVWPVGPRLVRRSFWSDIEMEKYRVQEVPLNRHQVRNVYLGSLAALVAVPFFVLGTVLTIAILIAALAGSINHKGLAIGIAVGFALIVAGVIYVIIRGRRAAPRRPRPQTTSHVPPEWVEDVLKQARRPESDVIYVDPQGVAKRDRA